MPADLPALRALLQSRTNAVGDLLRSASRMKVRLNRTSLLSIERHARFNDERTRPAAEYIAAMRSLAGLGFGRLLNAQNRCLATFEWYVEPRAVCAAAFDPSILLQPQDYLEPSAQPSPPPLPIGTLRIPEGWRQLTFPLRPESDVVLVLPADLTQEEARRLGHLLMAHASGA